jgi:hypothetical protein
MPEAVENAKLLRERFEQIRRELPGEPNWYAVYCNRCGLIEGSHSFDTLIAKIEGWKIAEQFGGNDYCPRCRDTGEGWAGSFPKRR